MHCLAYTCISGTWNRITLTSFSSFSQTKQYENQLNLRAYCEDCKRNFKWPTMPDLQRYPLSTMNNTWSTMYNTRSKMYNTWSTMYNTWSTMYNTRSTMYNTWSTMYNTWSTLYYTWSTMYNTRSKIYKIHIHAIVQCTCIVY